MMLLNNIIGKKLLGMFKKGVYFLSECELRSLCEIKA